MKEKVIDGIRFSVAPFHTVEAVRLQSYLIKTVGPFLTRFIGSLFKDGFPTNGKFLDANIKFDGNELSQAIENLTNQLTEGELESLIRRLFKNVTAHMTKDGNSLQLTFTELTFENSMDMVFAGKVFSIYPVMLFVLEVNFPDFLSKMAQGFGLKIKEILTSGPGEQSSTNESTQSET
jgi:hypothetical protein